MSKYDFELDLSENTSTGRILSKIKKGSTVLEFGCAEGRMTRYMQQALDCRVYIVEIDENAFSQAVAFAQDGLRADIMDFGWVEKFAGIGFDAIIFADVLEHLSRPEKVLEQAAGLLKDTGEVFISLPNITHNDILLKAGMERFDYTATGILDDTHVHFWGLENLRELSGIGGLHLSKVEATTCPTGQTEQFAEEQLCGNTLLRNLLRRRKGGEVYQFVLTLDKHGAQTDYLLQQPALRTHIYLDTGEDFNARQVLSADAAAETDGSYRLQVTLENIEGLCRVRLDPVEQQGCILKNICICQNEEELQLQHTGYWLEEGLYLPGEDPMVIAAVRPGGGVQITADILLPGEDFLQTLDAAVVRLYGENTGLSAEKTRLKNENTALAGENQALQQNVLGLSGENRALQARTEDLDTANRELHGIVNTLDTANRELQEKLSQLLQENRKIYETLTELSETTQQLQRQTICQEQDIRQKKETIRELTGEKQKLEKENTRQQQENEILRRDVGSYIVLVNKKDAYALELERNNRALEQNNRILEQQRDEYACLAEQTRQYYDNLEVVRLRRFAGRVLKGIWRRLKRLFGRG